MKSVSLLISLILTAIVFSMSFVSGESSASLSLEVTNLIYNITSSIIPNNQIDINALHLIVRKSAHVLEYMVLAISWFYTIKLWKGSFGIVLFIGLFISITDEMIQVFSVNRGASFIDVFVFDYLPFCVMGTALLLLNNRKEDAIMASATLSKLQENAITPSVAYKELYKKEKRSRIPVFRRAHFIKLRINVPGEKGVNRFLKVLFFLPLPILFIRVILSFVKTERLTGDDDFPLNKKEIMRLISFKGTIVNVNAHSGEKVIIKTI